MGEQKYGGDRDSCGSERRFPPLLNPVRLFLPSLALCPLVSPASKSTVKIDLRGRRPGSYKQRKRTYDDHM